MSCQNEMNSHLRLECMLCLKINCQDSIFIPNSATASDATDEKSWYTDEKPSVDRYNFLNT